MDALPFGVVFVHAIVNDLSTDLERGRDCEWEREGSERGRRGWRGREGEEERGRERKAEKKKKTRERERERQSHPAELVVTNGASHVVAALSFLHESTTPGK